MGDTANNGQIRFGVFELDPRTRELRRNGVLVKLQDQPFQVLLALIEKPGELVTREELEKKIWPGDTFVDFEVGLSRAVNKLRDALGDTAENPRFVQTLPKRGYRFIAPVDGGDHAPSPTSTQVRSRVFSKRLFAVVAALPFLSAGVWLLWRHYPSPMPAPTVKVLTSYSGLESQPTFSPDGSQVAFTWGGPKRDNTDIYVKLIGSESALRLTTDRAAEVGPAWSPDGKHIAFLRGAAGRIPTVYVISPLGGDEQKLAEFPRAAGLPLSWSPDGNWLALTRIIGESPGIHFLPVAGGKPRRITFPKPPARDLAPSISADGKRLAYAGCTTTFSCDVHVQDLDSSYSPKGPPRRITQQNLYIRGLTWMGDDILYTGSLALGMMDYLWRVGITRASTPERLETAGVYASFPAFSQVANRLVFSRGIRNFDIWRYIVGGSHAALITSSLDDTSVHVSPDGTKIVFCSSRSGEAYEIWVADADGSNQIQLTHGIGRSQGAPRWSPDGRWIAFDSLQADGSQDILVVESNGGRPRSLGLGPHQNGMPSWSRDGSKIYFLSDRTGRQEIWRVAANGGQPERITDNGGHNAWESVDGKTLFYTKGEWGTPLFTRPVAGGQERVVVDYIGPGRDFPLFDDGFYYTGRPEGGAGGFVPLHFYQFSTASSRLITRLEQTLWFGLTVSPDRKTIFYTRGVQSGGDLMLIENFR